MSATQQKTIPNRYYSPFDGLFRIRRKEANENTKTRIIVNKSTKEERVIFEERYSSVSGLPFQIYTDIQEYPSNSVELLTIVLFDPYDKTKEVIQTRLDSGFASDFIKRLPNVDLKKAVELKCFSIESEKNPKYKNDYMIPYQGGVKIESFFTKENPNGLPAWEKRPKKNGKKGEMEYDRSLELQFFRDIVEQRKNELIQYWKQVKESVKKSQAEDTQASPLLNGTAMDIISNLDGSDLPF